MKHRKVILGATLVAFLGLSCNNIDKKTIPEEVKTDVTGVTETPIKSILTAEEQAEMSPDEIIGRLKKGNENFVANNLTTRDHSAQRRLATMGQYPKALVLSCVDSRVPVEDVFDLGIGDIFVARVAGNIENNDIVGSMEFASAVAGSKVIIVMGHTACGAVKHAVDNTDAASLGMNSLQHLLDEIKPSIMNEEGEEVSSKNIPLLNKIITNNVHKTVDDIRLQSPVMKTMEDEGKLKIIGAVYDMETGKVSFKE